MGISAAEGVALLWERLNVDEVPLTRLALADEIPIGTASLTWEKTPKGVFSVFLSGVYVVPEFRGQGIGSLLCGDLITEAQRLGCERVCLYTLNHEPFYRHLGWSKGTPVSLVIRGIRHTVCFMERTGLD